MIATEARIIVKWGCGFHLFLWKYLWLEFHNGFKKNCFSYCCSAGLHVLDMIILFWGNWIWLDKKCENILRILHLNTRFGIFLWSSFDSVLYAFWSRMCVGPLLTNSGIFDNEDLDSTEMRLCCCGFHLSFEIFFWLEFHFWVRGTSFHIFVLMASCIQHENAFMWKSEMGGQENVKITFLISARGLVSLSDPYLKLCCIWFRRHMVPLLTNIGRL